MDDIRKAKELGLSPQALIKNVPGPSQKWKASIKVWIHELYEKRIASRGESSKEPQANADDSRRSAEPRSTASSERRPGISHDSVVQYWKENAKRNDDENYRFLRSLKSCDYGFDVDEVANELHQSVFQIVDCTQCANCCKTKRPKFDESDVERIAAFLGMDESEFIDKYLEPNPDDPPYRTRQMPCPLLGEDNRCTVYDVRPAVCREYPYTDKEGLVFRTMSVANNALVCPAVFRIVEQMKQRVGRRFR
jgi:Fe-S-cluster containining protein